MDFETIYQTYFGDVYRYLLRLTGSNSLSEELTADTFFKAMKSLSGFRGDCEIRVWLCQIAKNAYLSYQKKNRRTAVWEDDAMALLPDDAPGACRTQRPARYAVFAAAYAAGTLQRGIYVARVRRALL